MKLTQTIDVLIGGWLPGSGYRARVAGSVIAGIPGPDGLRYIGDVGSGFAAAELAELTAVLTAEVAYAELTPTGHLRHPVWRGLRAG